MWYLYTRLTVISSKNKHVLSRLLVDTHMAHFEFVNLKMTYENTKRNLNLNYWLIGNLLKIWVTFESKPTMFEPQWGTVSCGRARLIHYCSFTLCRSPCNPVRVRHYSQLILKSNISANSSYSEKNITKNDTVKNAINIIGL